MSSITNVSTSLPVEEARCLVTSVDIALRVAGLPTSPSAASHVRAAQVTADNLRTRWVLSLVALHLGSSLTVIAVSVLLVDWSFLLHIHLLDRLIIVLGSALGVMHLAFVDPPLPNGLGRLFAEFSRQIVLEAYPLPSWIPFYAEGGIPFAYRLVLRLAGTACRPSPLPEF